MILKEIKSFFFEELKGIYTLNEINYIWKLACKSILNIEFSILIIDENLNDKTQADFFEAVSKLKNYLPCAYVFGESNFYGLDFKVNSNVLIPRPETEELVELCSNELKKAGVFSGSILEIGTGSGCIAISLSKIMPSFEIFACDISPNALVLANENKNFHQSKIEFFECNYLDFKLQTNYDVFISNPPYIALEEESEISESVKNFEPKLALFAPKNRALAFYEKIAEDIKAQKPHACYVFVEINQKLGKETLAIFENVLDEAYLLDDISGNPRFVWGKFGF